jgi:hypothetical protein
MATNLPLTIQTVVQNGPFSNNSQSVIGTNRYYPPNNGTLVNVYWALVIDRTSLKVLENFTFTDNAGIPAQLAQYANNSNYLLMLTTSRLQSNNLPVGNFYNFLVGLGAGSELFKLEQIYNTLSCGTWGNMGYAIVAVLDGSVGIEFSDYLNTLVAFTLQLTPVSFGSSVLYTPIRL